MSQGSGYASCMLAVAVPSHNEGHRHITVAYVRRVIGCTWLKTPEMALVLTTTIFVWESHPNQMFATTLCPRRPRRRPLFTLSVKSAVLQLQLLEQRFSALGSLQGTFSPRPRLTTSNSTVVYHYQQSFLGFVLIHTPCSRPFCSTSLAICPSDLPFMPRQAVNLKPLRDEISHRVLREQQPVSEILNWLAMQGIIISRATLKRRLTTSFEVTSYLISTIFMISIKFTLRKQRPGLKIVTNSSRKSWTISKSIEGESMRA